MAEPALNNLVEWTVSELSSALRRTVEDAYGYVRVRGEVSGFKGASPSGHVYFRLKDDKAVLEAVIWKGTFGRMRVRPEEGLDVIVSGKLTTFAGSSKYQIVIDSLEPAGIGALMKLLEERKKKLAAEGLFDEARKQLLPFLPGVIGVVTSPTGAVIRDILHRLPRPLSAPRAGVAGARAGRDVGRRGRRRDSRFQRAARRRRHAAARPDHRRARRRLARGSVVVQRRDRGAGGGGEHDPAHLGGRSRDRCDVDRFRGRPARADADGRRRNGGAGARRADDDVVESRLAQVRLLAPQCRRNRKELRLLARALPALDELLAVPRQRLDACAGRLPRALRANAQIHHTQLTRAASRLSPRLLSHRIERCREQTAAFGDRAPSCVPDIS